MHRYPEVFEIDAHPLDHPGGDEATRSWLGFLGFRKPIFHDVENQEDSDDHF